MLAIITLSNGVKQGEVLSPILFGDCTDWNKAIRTIFSLPHNSHGTVNETISH